MRKSEYIIGLRLYLLVFFLFYISSIFGSRTLIVEATDSSISSTLLFSATNKLSTSIYYWDWATVWGGDGDKNQPFIKNGTNDRSSENLQLVASTAIDDAGRTNIAIMEQEDLSPATIDAYQEFNAVSEDSRLGSLNLTPIADAGIDQQICEGTSVQIGSADLGDTYAWGPAALHAYMSPNANSSQVTFTPPDTGSYNLTVTVTDINDATNSDEVTITVLPVAIANAGTDQYVCSTDFTMAGTPTTLGTGTWSYESGAGTLLFADIYDANSAMSGLTPGNHVFRWTITGNDICNAGVFDDLTLIYEDPSISIAKNRCQPNTQNYDVIVLISDGSLFSVSEGVVGAIDEYTTISTIDSSAQLQVIAVSTGNCRDTTLISAPVCPDCIPVCLPVDAVLQKGSKE